MPSLSERMSADTLVSTHLLLFFILQDPNPRNSPCTSHRCTGLPTSSHLMKTTSYRCSHNRQVLIETSLVTLDCAKLTFKTKSCQGGTSSQISLKYQCLYFRCPTSSRPRPASLFNQVWIVLGFGRKEYHLFLFFFNLTFCFLIQSLSTYPWLPWNLLYNLSLSGRPWTHRYPFVSASPMLGLKAHDTTSAELSFMYQNITDSGPSHESLSVAHSTD